MAEVKSVNELRFQKVVNDTLKEAGFNKTVAGVWVNGHSMAYICDNSVKIVNAIEQIEVKSLVKLKEVIGLNGTVRTSEKISGQELFQQAIELTHECFLRANLGETDHECFQKAKKVFQRIEKKFNFKLNPNEKS